MKAKPEKKEKRYFVEAQDGEHCVELSNIDIGWNACCDAWEEWLPTEEELEKLIKETLLDISDLRAGHLATAISRRLGGKNDPPHNPN